MLALILLTLIYSQQFDPWLQASVRSKYVGCKPRAIATTVGEAQNDPA
jgi:hypothetical protein